MKVDGLGVVLAIILLPIILVVTYYIQLQVDTIAKENTYNTKLLNATYDAMSAFEINTANEELSTVADSMRSMILASNNVFLNSLATNLGISNASKEHLQQYIPAVLYTMYDGYYIYAPTETPMVGEKTEKDANGLIKTKGYLFVGEKGVSKTGNDNYIYKENDSTQLSENYGAILYCKPTQNDPTKWDGTNYVTNREDAVKKTDYILKSYVQYSARYVKDEIDVTINYTLDNYLNIVGTINKVYYTKTGYLIDSNLVESYKIGNDTYEKTATDDKKKLYFLNEDEARDKILGVKTNSDVTTSAAAEKASVKVNGLEITANRGNIENALQSLGYGNLNITTISETETYLEKAYQDYENTRRDVNLSDDEKTQKLDSILIAIRDLEYEMANYKAIAYYVSSSIFSNWVYDNLSELTYGNIQDTAMTGYYGADYQSTSGVNDFYYDFHNEVVNGRKIFNGNEDPEKVDSLFNTHKLEVIKNSIKYNLNLSISAYSKMKGSKDFSLPILLDEEWDKILQNISIVSFMQGLDCGLRIYNNYEIVSSTNNELTVTPSEIYYVKKGEFNNAGGTFHRIDCPQLGENEEYISFKSKEVKYDQIYNTQEDSYHYDHRNLACYQCINTNNYSGERCILRESDNKEIPFSSYYEMLNLLTETKDNRQGEPAKSEYKRKAGYISIAKERQNIYKTNALPVSEGYEMISQGDTTSANNIANVNITPGRNLNNIKELQITLEVNPSQTNTNNGNLIPTLTLLISANNGNNTKKDITLTQSSKQTIVLEDVTTWSGTLNWIKLEPDSGQLPNGYSIQYIVKSIKAIYK